MNIQSFVRRVSLALGAGVALCTVPLALATTVTLTPSGFANGYELFNVSVPTVLDPNAVDAGGFAGTLNTTTPIVFFCFELTQEFSFGPSYTYDDEVETGGKYTLLSELFTEAFSTSTASTLNSVAFQLAVWEILEEPSTPDSLSPGGSQGTFYVTNDHGNTTTVAAANALIAGLPTTGLYTIHLLHNDNSQDFVYGTLPLRQQVPEPAPLMLIAAAMIALFALRRRVSGKRAP